MTLQSHGIGVEGVAEEVSTDAGQPQVHEEDEEQCIYDFLLKDNSLEL